MNPDLRRSVSRSSQSYFQRWELKDREGSDNAFSSEPDAPISPTTFPSRRRLSNPQTESMEKMVTSQSDSAPLTLYPPPSTFAKRLSEGRATRMESISESGDSKGSSLSSGPSDVGKRSVRWSDRKRSSNATYASSGVEKIAVRPILPTSHGGRSVSSTSIQTSPMSLLPSHVSGRSEHSLEDPLQRRDTPNNEKQKYAKSSSSRSDSPKPLTPLMGPSGHSILPLQISGATVTLLTDFVKNDPALQQERQAEETPMLDPNLKQLRNHVPKVIRQLFSRRDKHRRDKNTANLSVAYQPQPARQHSWRTKLRSGRAPSNKQATPYPSGFGAADYATTNLLDQVSAALEHMVVDQHDAQHRHVDSVDKISEPFFSGPGRVLSGLMGKETAPPQTLVPAAAAIDYTYKHHQTLSASSNSSRIMERRRGEIPQSTPAPDAIYKAGSLPSAWQTQEFVRIDITDPAGPSYLPSEMRRIPTPRGSQEMLHDTAGCYDYTAFGAHWGESVQTKEEDDAEAARQIAQIGKEEAAANEFAKAQRERRERERVPRHLPGSPLCPASPNWYYRDKTRPQGLGSERRCCPEHGWRVV